jgi:hypothetical protein
MVGCARNGRSPRIDRLVRAEKNTYARRDGAPKIGSHENCKQPYEVRVARERRGRGAERDPSIDPMDESGL